MPEPRRGALARYLLFQVPGWCLAAGALAAAVRFLGLSLEWAAAGFALWLLKDAVLYPIVRRAYEPDGIRPHGPLPEHAIAESAIEDEGWVRAGPERWRARRAPGAPAVAPGATVRVVAVRGLVLLVEPE